MKSVDYYFREGEIAPLYCFGETDTGKHFFLRNDDGDIEFGHFGTPVNKTFEEWVKIFPESKSYFKAKLDEALIKFNKLRLDIARAIKDSGPIEADKLFSEDLNKTKIQIRHLEEILTLIKTLSTPRITVKLDSGVIIDKALVDRVKSVPISNFIKFNRGKSAISIWNPTEKTPSMHYYSKDNRVHCFSSGKHGDVIDVIQQMHGLSFVDAVRYLSKYI